MVVSQLLRKSTSNLHTYIPTYLLTYLPTYILHTYNSIGILLIGILLKAFGYIILGFYTEKSVASDMS